MNQRTDFLFKFITLFVLVIAFSFSSSMQVFAVKDDIPLQFKSSGKTAPDGSTSVESSARASLFVSEDATADASVSSQLKNMQQQDNKPECPPSLMAKCHFVPAAYALNNPPDKGDYGNYDTANRPYGGFVAQPKTKLPITTLVIHDTEGSLQDAIALFQNPATYTSAHYIIDTDGQIYQMVRTKDVAWHAGNWYTNMHSIGIEHVGHAVSGGAEYTPEMYRSSALLTQYLANRFNIPQDHAHIIGHDNVQGPTQSFVAGMHYDPGPFWNWKLLLKDALPSFNPSNKIVTITRPFVADNDSPVTDCSSGTCVTLPNQPTNFVYLRTAPNTSAALLSDSALHPDGSAGTTNIDDWSATAVYGQQFVVADRKKDWTAIWFGGQIGWFHNPDQNRNARSSEGTFITPRQGLVSIPVYGRAYPEASAYSGTQVPVQTVVPLNYTITAGQKYSTNGKVPTDYYYSWNIDASLPDDHTVVVGKKVYLQIQFNHRIAYVNQDDVTTSH